MKDTLQTHKIPASPAPRSKKTSFLRHPKRCLKLFEYRLYRSQYLYLLFCFLVPTVLMYLTYVAKGLYPFFDGSPMILDLNAQYVYFFETIREAVYGDGSLLYSFGRSLGGEFMGIYAYYTASPLTYLVALFPKERIQEAILCMMLLKTGLSGLTFGFYLHKRTSPPRKLAVFIFSVMYALSAYSIVQQNNTMWMDAFLLLPIFVYALELLITHKKYKLYVITLSAIMIFNYYIGYMVCIFAVLYFFYYYFSLPKDTLNPKGSRLHFIGCGVRFGFFSLLSAGISAFMLIAAYYSLGFGKSEFSYVNWGFAAKFEILDFLCKLLPGSFDTVRPEGLPFVYCGVLTLISLPVYFAAKRISPREKIASAALVAVFLLSFIIKPIDLIWHGFSTPNWINGRYSFLFCFFILVLAYKGFCSLRDVTDRFLLGIGGLWLILVAVAQKVELDSFINSKNKLLTFGCVWFSVFFIIAIVTLLCLKLQLKAPRKRQIVSSVLAAVVCVELLANGIVCFVQFHEDVAFTTYSSYQNSLSGLRPVIEQVEELDDGFYRMEKTYHRTRNDNMALRLRGISNSTSTLNASAINFVNLMGYTGRAHLTMYRGGTPFSDSFMGIKYVIDYKSSNRFTNVYEPLPEIESKRYAVYENPYALSLAFGVDSAAVDFKPEDYRTFFSRYNNMLSAMLGSDTAEELFVPVKGMTHNTASCEESNSSFSIKCVTSKEREGSITMTYTAPYTGNYYFYSPVSIPGASKELKVKFNGGDSSSYMGSDTNCILYAGYHEKDSKIEVRITIPKDYTISFNKDRNFLWYLDQEVYTYAMKSLLDNPSFDIDPDSVDHHLKGSITTADDNQTILTTIPYDEGWNVFVDGKRVDIDKAMNTLMSFEINEAGEHTLELKYMPKCYLLGATVSVIAILIFLAICTLELLLKSTLLKGMCNRGDSIFWQISESCDALECENEQEPASKALPCPVPDEEKEEKEEDPEHTTPPHSDVQSDNNND